MTRRSVTESASSASHIHRLVQDERDQPATREVAHDLRQEPRRDVHLLGDTPRLLRRPPFALVRASIARMA